MTAAARHVLVSESNEAAERMNCNPEAEAGFLAAQAPQRSTTHLSDRAQPGVMFQMGLATNPTEEIESRRT